MFIHKIYNVQNIPYNCANYSEIAMTEKLCKTCGEVKALELFGIQTKRPDGRSSQCKGCVSKRSAAAYASNREKIKAKNKARRDLLKETNLDLLKLITKRYNQNSRNNSRGALNAYRATYWCKKGNNAPAWLTKEQINKIKQYYVEANRLTRSLGVSYHVDHIIPLRGKTASGLHVPWNLQIILGSDNRKKSNKIIESTVEEPSMGTDAGLDLQDLSTGSVDESNVTLTS